MFQSARADTSSDPRATGHDLVQRSELRRVIRGVGEATARRVNRLASLFPGVCRLRKMLWRDRCRMYQPALTCRS